MYMYMYRCHFTFNNSNQPHVKNVNRHIARKVQAHRTFGVLQTRLQRRDSLGVESRVGGACGDVLLLLAAVGPRPLPHVQRALVVDEKQT